MAAFIKASALSDELPGAFCAEKVCMKPISKAGMPTGVSGGTPEKARKKEKTALR